MTPATSTMLRFPGEVTIANLIRFKKEYTRAVILGEDVVIDLADVNSLNSAFIGVLINLKRYLGEQSMIVLNNAPAGCELLIHLCKLGHFVSVV